MDDAPTIAQQPNPQDLARYQEFMGLLQNAAQSESPALASAEVEQFMDANPDLFSPEDAASVMQQLESVQAMRNDPSKAQEIFNQARADLEANRATMGEEQYQYYSDALNQQEAAFQEQMQQASPAAQDDVRAALDNAYQASMGMGDADRRQRLEAIYENSPDMAAPTQPSEVQAQRAALDDALRQQYAMKERLATEQETLTGRRPRRAALFGAGGAAATMAVLHNLYNAMPHATRMAKEGVKELVSNGDFDTEKARGMAEAVFKNATLNKRLGAENVAKLQTELVEHFQNYLGNSAEHSVGGFAKKASEFLSEKGIADKDNNIASEIAKSVQKVAGRWFGDGELKLGDLTERAVKGNKGLKNNLNDLISNTAESARNFNKGGAGRNEFIDNAASVIQEKLNARKFGDKFGVVVEKFNNLNKDHTVVGKGLQVGSVLLITAATAAAVVGIDHVIKSHQEKKKAGLQVTQVQLEGAIKENQHSRDQLSMA